MPRRTATTRTCRSFFMELALRPADISAPAARLTLPPRFRLCSKLSRRAITSDAFYLKQSKRKRAGELSPESFDCGEVGERRMSSDTNVQSSSMKHPLVSRGEVNTLP